VAPPWPVEHPNINTQSDIITPDLLD
jgi:hypothetical protein